MPHWDIREKTILITGATDGIGKAAALELLRRGARVFFTSRNLEKGERVRLELKEQSGNNAVEMVRCDLESLRDVKKCAEEVMSRVQALHVLVNNAGTMPSEERRSKDGYELNMAVNYFALVLLTRLLLPLLMKSQPSRVVNVASSLHREGVIDFDNLTGEHQFNKYGSYAASKLALVLFTRHLAREVEGSNVSVNAVHPGWINTKLARAALSHGSMVKQLYARFFKMHGPKEGGDAIVYLAAEPRMGAVTGEYFSGMQATAPSESAQNTALGDRLSEETAKILAPYVS